MSALENPILWLVTLLLLTLLVVTFVEKANVRRHRIQREKLASEAQRRRRTDPSWRDAGSL
jgi:hypothetical protein